MTLLSPAYLVSKRQDPPPAPAPRSRRRRGPPEETFTEDDILVVDFNPATLRLTYNNQFGDGKPYSHARETVAKLDVELLFDTTEYGVTVMDSLSRLATMTRSDAVAPAEPSSRTPSAPSGKVPVIEFHWAGKVFEGVVESMVQTIEYWSLEGIPMRATVQLSLKETSKTDPVLDMAASEPDPAAFAYTPVTKAREALSVKPATDAASEAGNPKAARSIAAFNGLESMRSGVGGGAGAFAGATAGASAGVGAGAGAGASLGVSAGVNLTAAAGFTASGGVSAGAGAGASLGFGAGASAGASAGAGLGAAAGVGMSGGAGAGFGAGAGAGFGAGAGLGAGLGAGIGASTGFSATAGFGATSGAGIGGSAGAFAGGSASAGLSASEGAFAGLGKSKTIGGNLGIDPAKLIPPGPPAPIGDQARFDSTGKLVSSGATAVAAGYVKVF